MSRVVRRAGVAARVPGGFGFFAAGKILLPGERAAAARGCRRVRSVVGTTAPPNSGRLDRRGGRERGQISSLRRRPASWALKTRAKTKLARAHGLGVVPAPGDVCAAGGRVRLPSLSGPRRASGAGPSSKRRADGVEVVYTPLYTLQTYARRRRAPPRPVKNKDRWPPLLPRLLHKGHAAVEAVAAQVVAVHTY